MEPDKCSLCKDDLMPDEPGPLCWQCEMQQEPNVIALPMSTSDKLLAALLALMAYLMFAGIR